MLAARFVIVLSFFLGLLTISSRSLSAGIDIACQLANLAAAGPEVVTRLRYTGTVFKRSFDDPSGFAFHGTSIDALVLGIRTGKIPSGYVIPGHLYLMPFRGTQMGDGPLRSKRRALEIAQMYAHTNAQDTAFLKALGLPFVLSNIELTHNLDDFRIDQAAAEKLASLSGRSADEIRRLFRESEAHRGVILYVSERVLKDFRVSVGDRGEGDIKAEFGDGLPVEYIVGIESLDDFSFQFLKMLPH